MSSTAQGERETFRPSDYLRGRHPDQYSDSETFDDPRVDRAFVGFHLESLTQRQQEAEFETFCRNLAQREISPNLRPQTGPTGGGDGKVDSETYPVDPVIVSRWFVADVRGGEERWGFAFSAKQDWRAKVRADVASAAGTGRGYTRVIFISNQAISSRKRSDVEAQLTKEVGIPVTIHDRTWILEKVFRGRHFDLLGSLGLDVPVDPRSRPGPQDLERSQELAVLEAQIGDPTHYGDAPYALAEDCLSAAILARGLNRPRDEVEGKFLRAERNAQRLKHPNQLLRIAYAQAWTTYFWFDDPDGLAALYETVEARALAIGDAGALDRLSTLFLVLQPAVAREHVSLELADLERRRGRLMAALEALVADKTRATSALRARTDLLMLNLNEAVHRQDAERVERIWAQFHEVVSQADRHPDFPFTTLFRTLKEVGTFNVDSPAFDTMFEAAVDVLSRRESQTVAGRAHAERARQKLRGGRSYDAIRLYGRAITRLRKEEATEDLVPALGGLSLAYEAVGLLWAARSAILVAAERSLTPYLPRGQIVRPALAALRRLNGLELRLGRPAQALSGMEIEATLRANVTLPEDSLAMAAAELNRQDRQLGGLLLRLPLSALGDLTHLPAALDAFGLDQAWMALVFALGDIDRLRREAEMEDDDQVIEQIFEQWTESVGAFLGDRAPSAGLEATATLRSRVLGMGLSFTVPNTVSDLAFAESILGVLEALLATSLNADIAPYREVFDVIFEPDPNHSAAPTFSLQRERGVARGLIRYAPPSESSLADRSGVADGVFQMVASVIGAFSTVGDADAWLAKVGQEEEAYGRAMSLFDVAHFTRKIFEDGPSISLADFVATGPEEEVPLQRTRAWTPAAPVVVPAAVGRPAPADRSPPAEMLDAENGSHPDRRISSLIDLPLWDAAGWSGCGQMWSEGGEEPPCLLMLFKNGEAGRQIFEGFQSRLGEVDHDGELRIAILRGLYVSNRHAYGVTVGQNLEVIDRRDPGVANRQMLVFSRRNVMNPSNPRNLQTFLDQMHHAGGCFVMPAAYVQGQEPEVFFDLAITTQHLVVRDAWQIGPNDTDSSILDPDDPPYAPPDVADPPALRALAQLAAMRARRGVGGT